MDINQDDVNVGIDWNFVEEITQTAVNWPASKREEWDRLRYPNGVEPESKKAAVKEDETSPGCYR